MNTQMESSSQFGRFILRRRLGSGGMAEVYLAEMMGPEGFRRLVALKRILAHLLNDEDFIASFISEARLGGSLNHPNIVQTIELGQDGAHYYLVMEYVEGPTLAALLRHRRAIGSPLPFPVVLDIARQICAGLAYAHVATDPAGKPLHMVHRDLKPENILLSRFGAVKITDFGIAKAASNLKMTVNGRVVKGTVAFMSPEQARGDEIDHRSDLYALGAILFEMLTLDRLYPGASGLASLRTVGRGEIADRLALLELHPPAVRALMARLLSVDREARYGSARELGEALMVLADGIPAAELDCRKVVQELIEATASSEADRPGPGDAGEGEMESVELLSMPLGMAGDTHRLVAEDVTLRPTPRPLNDTLLESIPSGEFISGPDTPAADDERPDEVPEKEEDEEVDEDLIDTVSFRLPSVGEAEMSVGTPPAPIPAPSWAFDPFLPPIDHWQRAGNGPLSTSGPRLPPVVLAPELQEALAATPALSWRDEWRAARSEALELELEPIVEEEVTTLLPEAAPVAPQPEMAPGRIERRSILVMLSAGGVVCVLWILASSLFSAVGGGVDRGVWVSAVPEQQDSALKTGPAPASAEDLGALSLHTTTPATVYWRGQLLGPTPLVEHPLPAGVHELEVRTGGPDEERTTIHVVRIEPGKTRLLSIQNLP